MFYLLYPPLDIKLFIKGQTNILQRSKSQFEVKYLPVREFHVFSAFKMCQKVPKRGFALTWSKRVFVQCFMQILLSVSLTLKERYMKLYSDLLLVALVVGRMFENLKNKDFSIRERPQSWRRLNCAIKRTKLQSKCIVGIKFCVCRVKNAVKLKVQCF